MLSHAYNNIIYSGVGAPGHGREVVYGLNSTDKWFLSVLITTTELPSEKVYDTQMKIHTSTANTYISLARGFQKHLSDPTCKNVFVDQGKYVKLTSQKNWTESEYHVQDRKCVPHISVKISCTTTQFLALICLASNETQCSERFN